MNIVQHCCNSAEFHRYDLLHAGGLIVESSYVTVACWWAGCVVELSYRMSLLHAGGLGV